MEEKQETKIEKEVQKRLRQRVAERAKNSARAFKKEFKKQTLTAITAAFAFLIALTWRAPIQKSVDKLISSLGLTGQAMYYEYLAAIIITVIGVIALILISKWAVEKKI
ncbi:MAG: DUF5654 family protein [Nanoarchaeota archaeon]